MSLIFILKPFPLDKPFSHLPSTICMERLLFRTVFRSSESQQIGGFQLFFQKPAVYFIGCGSSSADHCDDFREFPSFDYCFTQATEKLCCLTLWTIDGPEIMCNRSRGIRRLGLIRNYYFIVSRFTRTRTTWVEVLEMLELGA